MKEETARELYEALNHACELLNRATKTKRSPNDVIKAGANLISGMPRELANAAAREGAMGFLRKIPEPSEEKKTPLRTVLGDLPFLLRRALTLAAKELPYRRGKPTPKKLSTAQQRKEACDDVARLLSCGIGKKDALTQVGRKYDASSRTIRRLWQKYLEAAKSSGR